MNADELKRAVGRAAMAYVEPDKVIGVGTGSTANHFIDALAEMRDRIPGAVASSEATRHRLEKNGIKVLDLNAVESLYLYVDGADEISPEHWMIKGGGGALTREKIVAEVAEKFVCICDASKQVTRLGKFPLPIEVLPMAEALVARRGHGQALALWPDARCFALLDPARLGPAELEYGRAPDAKLPGGITP